MRLFHIRLAAWVSNTLLVVALVVFLLFGSGPFYVRGIPSGASESTEALLALQEQSRRERDECAEKKSQAATL
jgi:hypothetical protein